MLKLIEQKLKVEQFENLKLLVIINTACYVSLCQFEIYIGEDDYQSEDTAADVFEENADLAGDGDDDVLAEVFGDEEEALQDEEEGENLFGDDMER